MLTAAKQEKFSAPMVWTDECGLPLAADPACETHVTTTAQLSENSRLGFERNNTAPHQGSGFVNSTSALGIEPVYVTEGVRSSSSGRENDGAGVYYYRARYYSPTLQRFVSEDPTEFSGGINFYAYALNNPLSFIDPTGLDVTVNAYPGVGGNPAGHAGVSVNGSPAVGFNPAPGWDPVAILGVLTPELGIVPGAVLPITPGRSIDPGCSAGPCSVTIHTTPQQDQAMLDYIRTRTADPGIYQLYGRNCSTFVYDVLRAGGVNAPYTPFPRQLVNGLPHN